MLHGVCGIIGVSGNSESATCGRRKAREGSNFSLSAIRTGSAQVAIDIGTLISKSPDFRHGRPCIAGTGISVRTIAVEFNRGFMPEEIAADRDHLTLAQIYAAITYYLANKAEIDADLAAEDALYDELSRAPAKSA